jgi:hypothetical protein
MDLAPPFPKVEKGGKRWKKVEKVEEILILT